MSEKEKKCNIFKSIFGLKMAIEIANFVCICILVNLSRDNPLESHYIGDLSNYYHDISYNNDDNIAIEEHKLNQNKKPSSAHDIKNKIFLRKLVSRSTCLEIRENFEKCRGTKLSNVFDLNYDKIHYISIATLILYIVLFVFLIINYCLIEFKTCENGYYYNTRKKCGVILYLLFFLLIYASRFVLSLIIFYFMEKGDLELYDDFLDCPGVKVNFFKKMSDVTKLRNCYFTFIILNFLLLGIEKIENYFEFSEKSLEEGKISFDKPKNNYY